jgi:hypothetical protein
MTETPVISPSERLFREHIAGGRFQTGIDRGEWRIVEERGWPHVVIAVSAAEQANGPSEFNLLFDLTDYPTRAPTGMPWDLESNARLSEDKRPKGHRVGMAFRVNWESGRALYVPYDRVALEGHPDWKRQFPTLCWEPTKTITFYLRNVHELLNDDDYVGL